VVRGDALTINCPVFGYPMPKISWKKNEMDIVPINGVRVSNDRVLIDKVRDEDAGVYRCTAQNTIRRTKWSNDGKEEEVIESTTVVLEQVVRVKSELAWLWPLLVIVATVIILGIVIGICEWRSRRKEQMLLSNQQGDSDD